MPDDGKRPEDENPAELSTDTGRDTGTAPKDPLGLDDEPAAAGSTAEPPAPGKRGRDAAVAPAKPPKAKGRVLGFLGFLLGLAGLAGAGYLYYLLVYLNPQGAVDARIERMESRIGGSSRALEELQRTQEEALERFAAEQARERESEAAELLEAVNRLATQAPPSRREWKVAEVAYLLRIANHRVLMERDVAGALVLLRAADVILKELDDFSLYQVRAQLADEILSLENVESNDVQGLFLRLEAIKTEVSRQSVKLPRFEAPAAGDDGESSFWSALTEQLGRYFRFRRYDGGSVKPLLAPEEEAYLELNLRLMLERAQLAALRREQVVYEQSLQTAADWIATYLDQEDVEVRRSLEELDALSTVVLDRPLPDVSGSLSTLKSLGEA